MTMRHLTLADVDQLAQSVAQRIRADQIMPFTSCNLFGVPRGGIPAAYAVAHHLGPGCRVVDDAATASFIIDDIIDSGRTRDFWLDTSFNTERPFYALVEKQPGDPWVSFPWERSDRDGSAEDIPVRLLEFVGEDPRREGLLETPARFLKAWQFWTSGYSQDPREIFKVFEDGGEGYDQMIVQRDIPVWSHCEHHCAPFFGVAHIGYIPQGRIVGLSKLSRLVDVFARRLQVQERLTTQIATTLFEELTPVGVGVVLKCRHLCMESRGVRTAGTSTTTSALLGDMRDDPRTREEFLSLTR